MKRILRKPESASGPGAPAGAPAGAPVVRRSLGAVLYIEDDDANWDVAKMRLGNRYMLTRAKDAEQACRFISSFHQNLDAVLMDIQLQGSSMDGVTLTKLLRGTLPRTGLPDYARDVPVIRIPIVFVSANTGRFNDEELLKAGGSLVVPKPVDFVKLTLGLTQLTLEAAMGGLAPR